MSSPRVGNDVPGYAVYFCQQHKENRIPADIIQGQMGENDAAREKKQDRLKNSLITYLSCKDCSVQTPTIGNRYLSGSLCLAKVIAYKVLELFCKLAKLFTKKLDNFEKDNDAYQLYAKLEFRGYREWKDEGKAQIIYSQYQKTLYAKSSKGELIYDNVDVYTFKDLSERGFLVKKV